MTLQFPTSVSDSATQQALDYLAQLFPLGPESMQAVIVRKVAELPTSGEEGELLYNEADNAIYFFNGTEWLKP